MFTHEIDEDLILRLIQKKDTVALFELTDISRESSREWLPWLDATRTKSDSLNYIENAEQAFVAQTGMHCGIFYQGKLIGMISFNSIDWNNKIGYIGYWLSPDYQGKGIMTRATRTLIDYAFSNLHLHRIDIRAAVGNHKSRAIPERLGFTQEGLLRQTEWLYDHYVDHVVYGMLAAEWGG